jgi:hypothetical protein
VAAALACWPARAMPLAGLKPRAASRLRV